jgi:hypothetical protein
MIGAKPPMTRDVVYEAVGKYGYYDTEKTNKTFNIVPRNAQDTLRDCIRWLLYLDKIKPGVKETLTGKFPPDPEWNP